MIDSHCHLNDEKIINNAKEIVDRYLECGVEKVVNVGVDIPSSIEVQNQAHKYDSVYYMVGFHPEECEKYNEAEFEKFLQTCLSDKKFLGIGEIGLDYHYTKENIDKQKEVFISQIKLAKKYHLPFAVHIRDAMGDVFNILKENAPYEVASIIHCFSSSLECANELIKLGFYISFSGSVTFNNAVNLQNVAKSIPNDKLLVETDSPYLAPMPYRGSVNEPKNVVETANFIAHLRNCSYEQINNIVTNNFNKLFKIN